MTLSKSIKNYNRKSKISGKKEKLRRKGNYPDELSDEFEYLHLKIKKAKN